MRLNGQYWGTAAGALLPTNAAGNPNGSGGGWVPNGSPQPGFTPYHIPVTVLGQSASTSSSGASSSGGAGGGSAPAMGSTALPNSCYGAARSPSAITAIVLHDSEIAGGANYVSTLVNALESGTRTGLNPTWDPAGTGLSVQCCINTDGSITRLIPDVNIPFGATYANPFTVQVEQAGFSGSPYPEAQIEAAARLIAYWCTTFAIPIQQAQPVLAAAGTPPNNGVMMHSQINQAPAPNHGDPGPTYPFQRVLALARQYAGHS